MYVRGCDVYACIRPRRPICGRRVLIGSSKLFDFDVDFSV